LEREGHGKAGEQRGGVQWPVAENAKKSGRGGRERNAAGSKRGKTSVQKAAAEKVLQALRAKERPQNRGMELQKGRGWQSNRNTAPSVRIEQRNAQERLVVREPHN